MSRHTVRSRTQELCALALLLNTSCVSGGGFDSGRSLAGGEDVLLSGIEIGFGRGEGVLGLPSKGTSNKFGGGTPRFQFVVKYSHGTGNNNVLSGAIRFMFPPDATRDWWEFYMPLLEIGGASRVASTDSGARANARLSFSLRLFGGTFAEAPQDAPRRVNRLLGLHFSLPLSLAGNEGNRTYWEPEYRLHHSSAETLPKWTNSIGLTVGKRSPASKEREYVASYAQCFGLLSWAEKHHSQRILFGLATENIWR